MHVRIFQLALIVDKRELCGASILNSRFALTAAHCLPQSGYTFFSNCFDKKFNLNKINSLPADRLTVYAGSSRLFGGTAYVAKAYHIHPKYNGYTMDFDVGIIEVGQSDMVFPPLY